MSDAIRIIVCVILGVVIRIMYDRRKQRKRETKEITKAFVEGYKKGLKEGEFNAMLKRYTPNQIREAFGVCKIEKKGENND